MADAHPAQRALDGARFLSLKWKLILTLSVVLLSVNGGVSWLDYQNRLAAFAERRSVERTRHLNEALALKQSGARQMQRMADMTASLISMAEMARQSQVQPWQGAAFDAYWAALQLNLNIEEMRFYDAGGRLTRMLGAMEAGTGLELAQVREALRREASLAWLDCTRQCMQSAAAPVLAEGQVAGVVVVSGLLADMIIAFRELTGVDVGLLSPLSGNVDEQGLPALGMRVSGLSNSSDTMPLLRQLKALPQPIAGQGWLGLEQAGRQYELAFAPLDAPHAGQEHAWLVVIEDVSTEFRRIRRDALMQFAGQLTTSLLVLALLVLLLNRLLGRMTRAAQAIPLLGQHAFGEARALLQPRARPVFVDEIDHLDRAAVTLSLRLQALEAEARRHAGELREALQRVSSERDFNQSLLDTAQVIILTLDGAGRILTVNRYGERLAGCDAAELRERCFVGNMCRSEDEEAAASLAQSLREVAEGKAEQCAHEGLLGNRDGSARSVVWSHTRLPDTAGEGAARVLSVGVDITERKRAEERLAYLAEHDPLTGLANRQHFQHALARALAVARRSGRGGALLYLDLDGFKYVNDISGHQSGDALLRMVAEELVAAVRDTDLVGRLGGDEMGVLLQDCDRDGAAAVARKVSERLGSIRFPGLSAGRRVTASIGIVLFPAGDADVRQILANADIAMYQAKANGRACWHVYAEGERMQEKLQQRVHWEERIKRALEEGGFVMHYQPILDIHAGRISHYEALLRMRDADGSLVPPGTFMEVAEESGLIREIDRHVVELAVGRLCQLLQEGRSYKIAINLSGISINDDSLLEFLRLKLARHPGLPQHLIFEITETAAVADFTAARAFMQAVHALGCAFSLDDFGAGFSSFYYVKHLPVDYVKIDGSFISHLADSPDDQVFVRALAEVARGFGKKTVAEFVESERVLALLRAYGVDFAQGYLIGRPGERIGP